MACLFERPRPVQSGRPLGHKVAAQHRSDMLMQEQLRNVQTVQEALEQALLEMEKAQDPEEIPFHRSRVDQLHQQAQEMIILLKLLHKLNTELVYARATLQKALRTGSDINTARKRVGWLEDRMERMLGRTKVQDLLAIQPRTTDTHTKPTTAQLAHADETLHRDSASAGPVINTNELLSYMDPGYLADYNTTNAGPVDVRVLTDQDSYTHIATPVERQVQPTILRKTRQSHGAPEGELQTPRTGTTKMSNEDKPKFKKKKKKLGDHGLDPEKTDVTHYPPSTTSTGVRASQESSSLPTTRENLDESVKFREELETVEDASPTKLDAEGSETEADEKTPEGAEDLQSSDRTEYMDKEEKPPSVEVDSTNSASSSDVALPIPVSRSEPAPDSSRMDKLPPVFITEGTTVSRQSRGSRVTIRTPLEMGDTEEQPSVIAEYDEPRDYWESEHHRFEYSNLNSILDEFDPTSYHRMGIAVPGTFVDEKGQDLPVELPWRNKKTATSISDIHEEALDKLSAKLHKMYERVQEAAMLSVDPHFKEEKTSGPTLLQSVEVAESPAKSLQGSQSPTKDVMVRPESEATSVSLPTLKSKRLGSSMSGRLVYYPKPLPLPEKLPVTKTVRQKEFPKPPEAFSESHKLGRPAAERIVDQRNLLEETKFTSSLFRPKKRASAPVTNEQQLRELLALDTAETQNNPRSNLRSVFKTAKRMASVTGGLWRAMKPKSGALEHTGLKWERVKGIVHEQLMSSRTEDRISAARQLGSLRCGDTMVIYALRERALKDEQPRVQYEASKALITLGCWEEDILEVILIFMQHGNEDMQADLVRCLSSGRNVQFVDKKMSIFPHLTYTLSQFCTIKDPNSDLAFEAAVCLSKLCVSDSSAKQKLKETITTTKNTHTKAKSLEMLVRQLNVTDAEVFFAILDQLAHSSVWKYRRDAAKLLILLGKQHPCIQRHQERVYQHLEQRLWDEPNKEVRQEAAKALAALNMFARACGQVEKNLEDQQEIKRVQAVVSLGTLGMKNERILRMLLEMLELDSSEFVRLMVMRTLGSLKIHDNRVIRALKDKERGYGPMAREATKALEALNIPTSQGVSKVMQWLDKPEP